MLLELQITALNFALQGSENEKSTKINKFSYIATVSGALLMTRFGEKFNFQIKCKGIKKFENMKI